MDNVIVKIKLSQDQAGRLYFENERNKDRIKELESFLVEIFPLIHAYGNERIVGNATELMPMPK